MDEDQYTLGVHGTDDAALEYQDVEDDGYPVEELIPNSVRHGLDPQTLSKPVDATVYGYDIGQMKARPWAKPGADKSDYFNYGFEEESWRAYCALQAQGIQSLRARADRFIAEILASQAQNAPAAAANNAAGGFHHTNSSQPYAPSTNYRGGEQSKFYKTQMCQGYLSGQCTRGEKCNYAHGQQELRAFTTDRPSHISASHHSAPAPVPPPMPVPTMGTMPALPPMPMSMPPPIPLGMPMPVGQPHSGDGVLSAHPIAQPPTMTPQAAAQPPAPKGPAGFRMVPAQKRDREKSPDVTY